MIAVIALFTMPIVTRERRRVRDDLVRGVVTVLLRVEDTPLTMERARLLGAEDASRRRIAVRNVDSGDLVIAVVLEARGTLQAGIDRGRGITPLGEDPDRLLRRVGVVGPDVEHERRVERVMLRVKRIATIFDDHQQVFGEKRQVVEARVIDITKIEERQYAPRVRRVVLRDLEDSTEATELSSSLGQSTRVGGFREVELPEGRSGTEHAVLGPLERCADTLGQGV